MKAGCEVGSVLRGALSGKGGCCVIEAAEAEVVVGLFTGLGAGGAFSGGLCDSNAVGVVSPEVLDDFFECLSKAVLDFVRIRDEREPDDAVVGNFDGEHGRRKWGMRIWYSGK